MRNVIMEFVGHNIASRYGLITRSTRQVRAYCSHQKEAAGKTQNSLILLRIIAVKTSGFYWNIRSKICQYPDELENCRNVLAAYPFTTALVMKRPAAVCCGEPSRYMGMRTAPGHFFTASATVPPSGFPSCVFPQPAFRGYQSTK